MQKNNFLIFNDIIYALYSCQSINELKENFLKRLKLLIPFSYASILFTDLSSENSTTYLTNPICVPDSFSEAEEEYLLHADEDHLLWLVNGKESTLIRESDLLGDESRLSTALYLKCYKRYNIFDSLQFSIVYQQKFLGVLTLFRTKIDGTFSDEDMFFLRSLGIHLNAAANRLLISEHMQMNSQNTHTIDELANEYHLTGKETEILSYIFSFKNNDEIAAEMKISENTIQKHLQNIFRKLNVSSKWELLKYK